MSVESEFPTAQITAGYETARKATFASAGLSAPEIRGVRGLYRQILHEQKKKLDLSDDTSWRALGETLRTSIRAQVIDSIKEDGWPLPDDITPREVGLTAVVQGCTVVEELMEERLQTEGEAALESTTLSYVSKDQFDRAAGYMLLKAGKIREDGALHDEWYEAQERDPEYDPAEYEGRKRVRYPEGIEPKLYQITKPHRYFPAQLWRYLELIRLGKMGDKALGGLGIDRNEVEKFGIDVEEYRDEIVNAQSVDDYAVRIATRSMEILRDRGIDDQVVTTLIVAGYNPSGPIGEHGDIPQVKQVWTKLLNTVKEDEQLNDLAASLLDKAKEHFASVGVDFDYSLEFRA